MKYALAAMLVLLSLFLVATAPAVLAASSTIIQQSVSQSNVSGQTDNVTISQSSSSSTTSVNNSTNSGSSRVESRSSETVPITQNMSGKIVTTLVNNASEPTDLLLGDWSLDGSGFYANLSKVSINGTGVESQYELADFRPQSVHEVNGILVFTGTVDVVANSTSMFEDVMAAILIYKGAMVLWIDQGDSEELTGGSPIVGLAD